MSLCRSWQRGHSNASGLCQAWLVTDTLDTPRAALWPCLQTCLLELRSSPAQLCSIQHTPHRRRESEQGGRKARSSQGSTCRHGEVQDFSAPTLRQDRYQQGPPGERGSPWTPELHPLTSRKDKGSRACLGGPRGHKARLMPGASRAILQEERRAQEGCCGEWRWQNNDG